MDRVSKGSLPVDKRIEIKPGENWELATWYVADNERKPTIVCPNCGSLNLGDDAPHRVEENGDVNNSVVCWKCDFHQFIRLVGWTGGAVV